MSIPLESADPAQPIHPQTDLAATANLTRTVTPNPDNPPWGVLQALLTWVASVAFLFLVPNLCVLPYVIYRYQGMSPTREVLLADKTFVFIWVSAFVPAHLITLILIWAVATRLGRVSLFDALGFSWRAKFGPWKSVGLGILLFGLAWLILIKFGGQETDLERILQSSRAAALATALIAVATAPLVEEIVYRGLLYSALQRVIGPIFAVVSVAGLFAILHVLEYWPNAGAITAISLLSLALTVVRARTGRLLPCFVIHLVFNGIQSIIIVFTPYLRALYEQQHHETGIGLINCLRFFS